MFDRFQLFGSGRFTTAHETVAVRGTFCILHVGSVLQLVVVASSQRFDEIRFSGFTSLNLTSNLVVLLLVNELNELVDQIIKNQTYRRNRDGLTLPLFMFFEALM